MALLTETNEQYYAGEQSFIVPAVPTTGPYEWGGDTSLVETTSTTNANFDVYKNNVLLATPADYTLSAANTITLVALPAAGEIILIKLKDPALWNNYGGYAYITINDIVNNFLVAYVGEGKLIPSAKRTLQEFSYDTLKSIKSQELTIPPSLSVIIPQDYVNYVKMSWIDSYGVKHIIYPTQLTSNPYTVPIQDSEGIPTQDNIGENLEGTSITNERWRTVNDKLITGNYDPYYNNAGVYNWSWDKMVYGKRYGLTPEISQKNGWFTINEREGKFSFSSNLKDRLIILEYISDGLSSDLDTKVPKMAEEAMYMHVAYSILAGRANQPEYVVQRYKKDRRAALRNAKIRLSNIKLSEIVQVMRGKSKWIKH